MSAQYCGCDPEANHQCAVHSEPIPPIMAPEGAWHQPRSGWLVSGNTVHVDALALPGMGDECTCPACIESPHEQYEQAMQAFSTGATRSATGNKPDYEGFLSPLVIESFGVYMTNHQKQADGKLRASDNWQKGIPLENYMKSLFRHFMQMWSIHRGYEEYDVVDGHQINQEEAINACLFNLMGYQHENLK